MNKNEKALFLGHFILLLLELLVVLHAFSEEGWRTLRFYTTDSNLLCGIASLLYMIKSFPKLNGEGKGVVSRYFQKKQKTGVFLAEEKASLITLLRFISTASLMVTFVVVLLVLGPENGYAHEFLGGMRFYSHLICPFLSLFLFVTGEEPVPKKWIPYALYATLLYAIPLIILNATGQVSGPYSFLKIREQSFGKTMFWIVTILSGNAVLAWGAIALQGLNAVRERKDEEKAGKRVNSKE